MLFYCGYTWQPHATAEQVRARFKQQHDAGTNHKQQGKAEHGEEGYEGRGAPAAEAEHRARATVNKQGSGGKKSGSGVRAAGLTGMNVPEGRDGADHASSRPHDRLLSGRR